MTFCGYLWAIICSGQSPSEGDFGLEKWNFGISASFRRPERIVPLSQPRLCTRRPVAMKRRLVGMTDLIEGRPFRTKARTVDHLGREQIADCPTAVSELWKNAYDAYARNVALDIYGRNEPVAVIVDDSHGMTPDEFVNRWLIVGAEGKVVAKETPDEGRHGLRVREHQGQKGIGRLSYC